MQRRDKIKRLVYNIQCAVDSFVPDGVCVLIAEFAIQERKFDWTFPNNCIIIDHGSSVIKAGLSNKDAPQAMVPNVIGYEHQKSAIHPPQHRKRRIRPRHWHDLPLPRPHDHINDQPQIHPHQHRKSHPQIFQPQSRTSKYIGHCAIQEYLKEKPKIGLLRPLERGIVADWDGVEQTWDHIFNELKVNSAEHPVLLSEAPLTPPKDRERITEIMFEEHNVPAFCLASRAVLSLYASGKTTGVVVKSGYGATYTVPIYQGYSIPYATNRIDFGGDELTEYLQYLLAHEHGYEFNSFAEKQMVTKIKEESCAVNDGTPQHSLLHELPDGKTIDLKNERYLCPEPLFKSSLVRLHFGGIHKMLHDSISKCDTDIQTDLYKNIVLSGGSTQFPGFKERLEQELSDLTITTFGGRSRSLATAEPHQKPLLDVRSVNNGHSDYSWHLPPSTAVYAEIVVTSPPNSVTSSWLGGALLASLRIFPQKYISGEEYDEFGKFIVHRKCIM